MSVTVAVPSDTSRVNSTGVSSETLGAAKEVSSAAELARVMVRAVELCDQEYVRVSAESGSVAVPSRFTVEPSGTVWSGPAFATGTLLVVTPSRTVTSTVRWLSVPKPPVEVTLTRYEVWPE